MAPDRPQVADLSICGLDGRSWTLIRAACLAVSSPRRVLAQVQPWLVSYPARHASTAAPAWQAHRRRLATNDVPTAGVFVAGQEHSFPAVRGGLNRPVGVGSLDGVSVGNIG